MTLPRPVSEEPGTLAIAGGFIFPSPMLQIGCLSPGGMPEPLLQWVFIRFGIPYSAFEKVLHECPCLSRLLIIFAWTVALPASLLPTVILQEVFGRTGARSFARS